jgi:hypothetical protein
VDGSMNIINTCTNPSVTDIYFTFKPDASSTQIAIQFANWGADNVLALVDIRCAGKSTTQPRGCCIASGQIYADNSGNNIFDNFSAIGLTQKDCSLTYTSGGAYTLRLTITPTYSISVLSGKINVINATSISDIVSVTITKV